MNALQTGDIVLVKFHPGYGSEFKKYRPAVVVSGQAHDIDPRFVMIAPLTTNLKTNHPLFEILISKNPALEHDSLLLCWYILTIDSSRMVKQLGRLTPNQKTKMRQAVRALL